MYHPRVEKARMITQYSSQFVRRVYRRAMRHFLGSITDVATMEPVAALTFDDGPHAEYTPRLLDTLWMRHKVILFNCEVGDWFDPDPHRLAEALVKKVHPGSIVCLHDALRSHPELRPRVRHQSHADREAMLTAVDMFLTRVGSQFRFITIPELLQHGCPQRQHWYRVTPLGPRSSAAPLPSS